MTAYPINHPSQATDRYKIYIMACQDQQMSQCVQTLQSKNIPVLNIGSEIATFITGLNNLDYLNIDVVDHLKSILDIYKSKNNNLGNDVIAIYNLGILFEPALELNAAQLMKDFSKNAALIIIWENQITVDDHLHWSSQVNNIFLDFSETPLKKLQYAI